MAATSGFGWRVLGLALCGAGLITAAPVSAPAAASGPVCFTAADNARLTFPVFQQAPPPRLRASAYRYYPLTAAVSMQMTPLQDSPPGIATYFFHWGNRSTAPLAGPGGKVIQRKGNFQPSALALRRQRSGFTSVTRADACTIAQLGALLGSVHESAAVGGSGISLVPETAQADAGAMGPLDSCVLPAAPLPRTVKGVLLDFEVADGRSPRQALALLQRYAAMVHASGRRALLLIDPFDAPTQRFTGISASNAGRIVQAFDETTLMLWAGNIQHDIPASYRAQRALVDAGGKVDPRRLIVDFDLAGTSRRDAAFVRDAIRRDHLGGVIFWRNRAAQGGDCASDVNRKIAAVAFGPAT
jgi:hypothetical protein